MMKRKELGKKRKMKQINLILLLIGGVIVSGMVAVMVPLLKKTQLHQDDVQKVEEVKKQETGRDNINLQTKKESSVKQTLPKPKMMIDKKKTYVARLETTMGDIVIKLNAQETPITVNNFVYLARKGFYDETIFHRVIKGFMIQGGDPKGDGTGGPGYRFEDEPFEGEYKRGTVAMANAGPNTNGSQFFIMHQDYALPKKYVIFGQVIKGMEVVDKIVEAPVTINTMGEKSRPIKPVVVKRVMIEEK